VAAHAAAEHHGPPVAHQSSRVDARVLGMLLFIASEVMLFGSFFTAYFFVRVVNGYPWPPQGFELPRYVAGINTAILITSSFTVHWALQSIRRGSRAGLQAGLVLTLLMGSTFLATQVIEYSRVGFAPHDNAFTTASRACTEPTCSWVSRCSCSRRFAPSGATIRRPTTTASSCPESTGTSST